MVYSKHHSTDSEVVMSLNLYVFLWVAFTFFIFLITVTNIKRHKSLEVGGSISETIKNEKLDIETSFYRADATLHDIIFFHASASGVAVVLLFLILKGQVLFPGTKAFFGSLSSIAIAIISTVLLILAFYFYMVSIFKLGNTLVKTRVNGAQIKTTHAIFCVFAYFLFFPIIALILV